MNKSIDTARNLRKDSTNAEIKLWGIIRNKKINGKKILRQHPINFKIDNCERFFIADFFCYEKKLIIELDGDIHKKQKNYDDYRTYIINILGYKVIRFSNSDILYNIEKVLTELKEMLS